MNCSGCKFVDVFVGEVLMTYECHRYPPIVVPMVKEEDDEEGEYADVPVQLYPQVSEEDWCGEFQEREEDANRSSEDQRGEGGDTDQNNHEGTSGAK